MRPIARLLKAESAATALAYGRIATGLAAQLMPAVRGFGATPALPPPEAARNDAERIAVLAAFAVISAAYFYAAILRATADHFWMDEVLAVSAAGQASLRQVWQAIWAGTDFSPPTYHVLLHGFVNAVGFGDSRLIWRIPSILAVYGAALCTYALLARLRINRLAAMLGFAVVLGFNLFDYAIQVRQYALLALGLAAAFLLWADMDEPRHRKARVGGLWAALAACLCLHFYGIVEVAAVGTAELIYAISRRRLRIAVWGALAATLPIEAALYPLAAHLAAFNAGDAFAPDYYARPTLGGLVGAVFEVVDGGVFGLVVLAAALLIAATLHVLQHSDRRMPLASRLLRQGRTLGLPALEIVMIALCGLPLLTFALSFLVTKSFSARYMVAGALLPAFAAAYAVDRSRWRQTIALALIPLIAGILVVRAHAPDPIGDALAVSQKAKAPYPVVIGEGLLYIELMQAADAATRSRLVYLKRPPGLASPDPTNENEVVRLAGFHPEYRVREQAAFLKDTAGFYVLYRPTMSTDTTTPALIEKGLLGSPTDAENGILLFRSPPERLTKNGSAR